MADHAKMEAVVQAYVAAFAAGEPEQVVALFSEDATVEDPVGAPVLRGRDAIREFYTASMATGATLQLEGPVRLTDEYAVFPFSVHLEWEGQKQRIDVIDTFRFNAENQVTEMRAYFGAANMHVV